MSLYDLLQNEEKEEGRVEGVALGIVTNNRDEEGLGRVKVKYPWREDSQDSYWARIALLDAGNQRGTFFLPEVDDEVLLGFDKGDIRHPYVLGVLWNGQDRPSIDNADGENNTRMIRSRSGHEIRFFDRAGQEQVEIKTQAGQTVRLDDSNGSARIEIRDSTGANQIIIDSSQNTITIESGVSLRIKSQSIDIEAGASINLRARGTLTLQGALVRIN
jgi:uncharacterized protein involved in type VI secretion and phage assembly